MSTVACLVRGEGLRRAASCAIVMSLALGGCDWSELEPLSVVSLELVTPPGEYVTGLMLTRGGDRVVKIGPINPTSANPEGSFVLVRITPALKVEWFSDPLPPSTHVVTTPDGGFLAWSLDLDPSTRAPTGTRIIRLDGHADVTARITLPGSGPAAFIATDVDLAPNGRIVIGGAAGTSGTSFEPALATAGVVALAVNGAVIWRHDFIDADIAYARATPEGGALVLTGSYLPGGGPGEVRVWLLGPTGEPVWSVDAFMGGADVRVSGDGTLFVYDVEDCPYEPISTPSTPNWRIRSFARDGSLRWTRHVESLHHADAATDRDGIVFLVVRIMGSHDEGQAGEVLETTQFLVRFDGNGSLSWFSAVARDFGSMAITPEGHVLGLSYRTGFPSSLVEYAPPPFHRP